MEYIETGVADKESAKSIGDKGIDKGFAEKNGKIFGESGLVGHGRDVGKVGGTIGPSAKGLSNDVTVFDEVGGTPKKDKKG